MLVEGPLTGSLAGLLAGFLWASEDSPLAVRFRLEARALRQDDLSPLSPLKS